MITWKELKDRIGREEEQGKRVPTLRQLQDSGVPAILTMNVDEDCRICVFQNGLVAYQEGNRYAVFSIESCKKITYQFGDGESAIITESEMNEEAWYLPLFMIGSDKVTKTREDRARRVEIPVGDKTDLWEKFSGMPAFFNGVLREAVSGILSKRQREILTMYLMGYTIHEIADITGTTRQNIRNRLKAAAKIIEKEIL